VSRSMNSLVVEYALQTKTRMAIAENVKLNFESTSGQENMHISINIGKQFKDLFELRFQLRQLPIGMRSSVKREDFGEALRYSMEFNVVEDEAQLKILRETIGGKMERVTMNTYKDYNQSKSSFVTEFLEDAQFDILQCYF
ncbi:hypothetical protein PMAYCL1PPCAC_20250, partial [Pristionchus mayeri]